MLRVAILASGLALAAAAATVRAQAPPQAPLDLRSSPAQSCESASEGEVVVCGQRGPSRFRIDREVLDGIRAEEARRNPPRVQDRSGNAEACGTGSNLCSGGTIPLLEPALRVAAAAVKAIRGEDWREPFRTGPSDYELYEQAKRRRAAARVTVGVSASGGN